MVILPALALAYAMNSGTVVTGTDGWTAMRSDADKAGNLCDVADEVEVEFFVEARVDHICEGNQKERVTVWWCSHDGLGSDIATGPRPVLNYE